MIVRAVDRNGDWTFGKGKHDYLKENDAIAQVINCSLREFVGDCFFALNNGIDWWTLLGGKSVADIENQVQAKLVNIEGVVSVIELSISLSTNRRLNLVYNVKTIFGATVKRSAGFLLTESGDILVTDRDEESLVL